MKSTVELAVSIPQTFSGRPVDPGFIRKFLARAEALGFHSAWVVEQILGSIPSLEPVELLTYAAAVTTRIKLGSAVLLTALRSPVHTAKSLATLDHLSGGRLIVGVGLGANPKIYPAYGITAERRAARFGEGIRVMKRLWTEPRVTFEGQFFKLENASMEPKPVQKPHPPIWFGAHEPAALRRAAEMGSGFMGAGSASTAQFLAGLWIIQGLAPAGYTLEPDGIRLERRWLRRLLRYRDIRAVDRRPRAVGGLGALGLNGLFGSHGPRWNPRTGWHFLAVTNTTDLVYLHTVAGLVVLSPSRPDEFAARLAERLTEEVSS